MTIAVNILNILTKTYAVLRNYWGLPYWLFTPARRAVRWLANRLLPTYLERTSKRFEDYVDRGNNIIVSFTSFPARINDVWQVVESLKRQTVVPEKIILWLSREQFPNDDSIPDNLRAECDSLFELRMVDEDIRSFKKFYYALQEYPDKTIVTCDDDVYYRSDMLQCLIEGMQRFPNCVISNVTKQIRFDKNGHTDGYDRWVEVTIPYERHNLVQIGVGGVLYPPRVLSPIAIQKELFMRLCPLADDLWLNCMSRLNHTPIVQSGCISMPLPIKTDSPSLTSVNVGASLNDEQIKSLKNHFMETEEIDLYSSDYEIDNMGGVIVSLTSFPARIEEVWLVVECMFRQTYKPEKIVLWLSREQFPQYDLLPTTLTDRVCNQFEIRLVDGDIRSHKKYHYVAKEYPNNWIFTVDDDIYYANDVIERSLRESKRHSNAVICNYGYHIAYDNTGHIMPYSCWNHCIEGSTDSDLFFGSGGGFLFKPSMLYEDLTDINLALRLTPLADDIWLNAMCRLAGVDIIMLQNNELLPVQSKQKITLCSQNVGECKNDRQLEAIQDYYYQKLGVRVFDNPCRNDG